MKKIFYKSIRDLKKLLTPFIVSVVFATSFVSLIARYLQGEKVPMSDFIYLLFGLIIILFFGFGIIFLINLFISRFINKNIFIYPIESAKKPKQKILLHIVNDNDDDMSNVRVELKKIFVDEKADIESVLRADNNFFSRGLAEMNNTISANTSAKIEIAENNDGILKLILGDEIVSDVLLGMKEFEKKQKYRLMIRVSSKIADTFFERDCEFLCEHRIDETIKIMSGTEEKPVEKYLSELEWVSVKS